MAHGQVDIIKIAEQWEEARMSGEDGDYEVGYKKPPQHTRFREGWSGNPRGRPPQSLTGLISKALDQKTVMAVDGKRCRASKREAIVAQLIDARRQPICARPRSLDADRPEPKWHAGRIVEWNPRRRWQRDPPDYRAAEA
jgi:hypothetical protein